MPEFIEALEFTVGEIIPAGKALQIRDDGKVYAYRSLISGSVLGVAGEFLIMDDVIVRDHRGVWTKKVPGILSEKIPGLSDAAQDLIEELQREIAKQEDLAKWYDRAMRKSAPGLSESAVTRKRLRIQHCVARAEAARIALRALQGYLRGR